jgi:hypothetical protein
MKRFREFLRLVAGLLRELADESAYRRHLERSGSMHSAEEWRRFSESRQHAKYAQPKCC